MSDLWLAGPVTSTAYGWRLERRDGITLGFTSHDRDVEVDGLLLRAAPGMVPSTITESIGLDVDGLDVRGALTADAIRPDDLHAGRWDSARLSIFLFDWFNPQVGKRDLAIGELGAVSHSSDSFEAEFRGPAAKLDLSVVPSTSPSCRAAFCDSACGLSSPRYTHVRPVGSVAGAVVNFGVPPPGTADAFAFGGLRWLEGPNCGLRADIIASGANMVQLASAPPYPVVPGILVELREGCDKTIATCATRFANAINFRGEPYLPGNDILTRYPGAS